MIFDMNNYEYSLTFTFVFWRQCLERHYTCYEKENEISSPPGGLPVYAVDTLITPLIEMNQDI